MTPRTTPVLLHDSIVATTTTGTTSSMDPKEAVKLFGRLAEKYIMLDSSGGMCCYSGCTGEWVFFGGKEVMYVSSFLNPPHFNTNQLYIDCEYREPGGGYRMADQSASRPKWIPIYEERKFESQGKEHTSKWSTEIFKNGPGKSPLFLFAFIYILLEPLRDTNTNHIICMYIFVYTNYHTALHHPLF